MSQLFMCRRVPEPGIGTAWDQSVQAQYGKSAQYQGDGERPQSEHPELLPGAALLFGHSSKSFVHLCDKQRLVFQLLAEGLNGRCVVN